MCASGNGFTMNLKLRTEFVTPLETNAYLVWDEDTKDGVLIDPGEFSHSLRSCIASEQLKIHYILNTHGHFDHIGGNADAARATKAKIVCHKLDAPMLENPMLNGAALFGFVIPLSKADKTVDDGDVLVAGSIRIRVFHTPGHSAGGVSYYIGSMLFSGDTLFAGGIGRYDLPGGSSEVLLRSIREKLLTLPDDTQVYPGHGPESTIGIERETNPFLRD